jgi:hypothetical protein
MVQKKVWSFKEQRQLIDLARASKSLDDAVRAIGRSPEAIKKMAMQLGLSFKPKSAKK